MHDITMLATRRTRAGVLREGKHYSVPNDVLEELDADSYTETDGVEAAVSEPAENAAKRTTRVKGTKGTKGAKGRTAKAAKAAKSDTVSEPDAESEGADDA